MAEPYNRNRNRDNDDKNERRSKARRPRRRVCSFCVDKVEQIDYKEVDRLRRFLTERGKILPRNKFSEEKGMRLPEAIFGATVTGEYPESEMFNSIIAPTDRRARTASRMRRRFSIADRRGSKGRPTS